MPVACGKYSLFELIIKVVKRVYFIISKFLTCPHNNSIINLKFTFKHMEGKVMAYKINEDCISCGACAGECPVSCISEGDRKSVV